MATYLIDFENVKSDGIRGITQLEADDTVVIFYSHNADTITFEAMDMIFSTKAQVRKYKIICGGKNALDFQLSTYLGYLIHEGTDSYFYIISKDNGFKHVVDFWKRTFNYEGYVYCFATIADGNARQIRFRNASAKEREAVIEEELVAMSEELEEEEMAELESETAPVLETVETAEPEEASASEEITETEEIAETEEKSAEAEKEEAVTAEIVEAEADQKINESEEYVQNKDVNENEPEAVLLSAEQESKPRQVSVTPPTNIPESVIRNMEQADREFAAADTENEEHLDEKIAAAAQVSDMKVKVVENNMTVHVVDAAKNEKDGENAKDENKSSHRNHRSGRRKKNPQGASAESTVKNADKFKQEKKEAKQEKADEKKPAESAEKTAEAGEQKPKRRTAAKKKPQQPKAEKTENKPAAETPQEAAAPQPARRGRRPKSNVKASEAFEK